MFWLARLGNFDDDDGKFLEGHVTYERFSTAFLNMSDVDVSPSIHLFANWWVSNIFQPVKSDAMKFGRCVCITLSPVVHHFRMVPSPLVKRKIKPFLVGSVSEKSLVRSSRLFYRNSARYALIRWWINIMLGCFEDYKLFVWWYWALTYGFVTTVELWIRALRRMSCFFGIICVNCMVRSFFHQRWRFAIIECLVQWLQLVSCVSQQ